MRCLPYFVQWLRAGNHQSDMGSVTAHSWFKIAVSLVTLSGTTGAVLIFSGRITELTSHGYIGLFLVAFVGSTTFVIPGPSLAGVVLGGAMLNPWLVGPIMGLGSALGELPGYTVGTINDTLLQRIPGARLVTKWMRLHAGLTIFVLAAIPNYLYDVGSLIAGVSGMPLPLFLVATIAGKVIRFTLAAIAVSFMTKALGLD